MSVLLHDYLHDAARRLPEKIALVCQGKRVTFAELEQQSNALAHGLIDRGVRRGDRVQLYLENSVEAVIAWWAVHKANAVPIATNPLTRAQKLWYYLNDARASVLIADAQLAPHWSDVAARAPGLKAIVVVGAIDAEKTKGLPVVDWAQLLRAGRSDAPPKRTNIDLDLAAIIYTSGSTGEPKGAMLTHANMLAASSALTEVLGMREDDVVLSALPLAFNYGLYQQILCFRVGARLVLEKSFAFPVKILERIAEEKATGFPGVPTMFSLLAELKGVTSDLSSIRFVTNTAAALTGRHIETLQRIFPSARVFSMYGLTECKRCSCLPPEDLRRKPDSIGLPMPNCELWLLGEDGARITAPNVPGELVMRGATVMRGYWEKPAATADRLRPGPLAGEVVFHTGDLCRFDEDGYLYFVSRMDDVIKSRGEKVSPREVETALMNVPGVKEAAVIGVADEMLGQAIKAFVVLEEGVTFSEKALQKEVQQRVETFLVPKQIVFVPELPKTDTGKIKKTDLR